MADQLPWLRDSRALRDRASSAAISTAGNLIQDGVGGAVGSVVNNITGNLNPLTAPVREFGNLGGAFDEATGEISSPQNSGNRLLNSDFASLNRFANQVDSNLNEFSRNLTDSIEGVVSPVQQAILETTASIDVGLGSSIVNARSVARNISSNVGSSIDSIVAQVPAIGEISSFANQLSGSIANVSSAINNIAGTVAGIGGIISGATSGISASLNNIGGAISGITGSGVGAAAGLSNAIGGVTGRLGGSIAGISAPFDKITSSVTKFNSKLSQGLNRINNRIANVTGTLDTINTVLTNPGAIIENKINSLVDAGISKVVEPISQLVNFGYNLSNQINSATNITTTELANLTGYVGGIFTGISGLLSGALNTSDFYQENNLSYVDGELVDTENGPKLLSPLRRFNHYNYVITLGILDPDEYNFPTSYRSDGFKKIILQSGGGEYDRRIQTSEEGNDHMEYFIEDLEIDAVVAPNPNTGVSLGTSINFKVIEPYSMGKFIETIVLGAEEAGYEQYMQAPYCLKIDFVGWNEPGDRPLKIQRPKYVPLLFTGMDFDVTDQGSTYEVSAVAYNELALADNINQTKASLEASGRTVAEVLETTEDSVGRNLSSRIELLEKNGQIKGGDRYLICFPKNKESLYEAAKGLGTSASGLTNTAAQQIASDVGSEQREIQPDDPDAETNVEIVYSDAPQTYQYLKSWAQDEANMNIIGKSPVWDDARAADRVPHPSAASAYDSKNQLFNRQYAEVQTEGRSRPYTWHEGCRITTMIEDVLTTSSYLLDAPSEDRDIPFFKWFRIETMVFIEPNTDAEIQNGRTRKTYVYAIHPYFPDEAKILGPGEAPKGNDDLKRKAIKQYNYTYTGKNEDILNFNLNFNQAFYQNILANYYQGPETGQNQQTLPANQDSSGSNASETKTRSIDTREIPTILNEVVNLKRSRGGAEYEAGEYGVKRRIAESVHETIINSPYNMVTAEMEIWGDPYYIPTEQGNYSSASAGPSLTRDSTMNYLRNEVLCVVNFRTPLDYPINGFVMNMPELVRPFSGVFQVWAVTNRFSDGQFTQVLKLLRRANQNSTETGTRGAVTNSDRRLNSDPSGQVGQVGGSEGATAPGDLGDGLRGGLTPRPIDEIVNLANNAIDNATNAVSNIRPPTGTELLGDLIPSPITVTTLPPIGSVSLPEVNLPSVDIGGRTVYNRITGKYESGY